MKALPLSSEESRDSKLDFEKKIFGNSRYSVRGTLQENNIICIVQMLRKTKRTYLLSEKETTIWYNKLSALTTTDSFP